MDHLEDIEHIKKVLEGNVNAFSYFVDKHKDSAYNLACKICGNHEEAEEIAQDSFVKAFRSLDRFKMESSFATWLYRIVYNTSISHVRTKKKKVLSLEDFPSGAIDFATDNPGEEEANKEYKNSLINYALKKIKEEERGLISLYYYEDMSLEEISELTGIGKQNIKVKLFRARKKMLEIIENAEKKNLVPYE
jgi:RNA polymerase sigma-70 factor (ECF subfamily)